MFSRYARTELLAVEILYYVIDRSEQVAQTQIRLLFF